jgi:puromycin-sensitive aminopeptidase
VARQRQQTTPRSARPRERSPAPKNRARVRRSPAYRLPHDVDARTIELTFELDPHKSTFKGRASYALEIARRRKSIELHSLGLRIAFVRLHLADETLHGRVEHRPESESIVLGFDRLIPEGPVRLELAFRGRVRRDLRGLYGAGSGDEAWLASQLCPTDARRLFPCFDEPGMKSRYRISVTAPADQTVISNAPISDEETTENGQRLTRFEATPPLSSYLVAVAVGPFEASPVAMSGTTALRVWTLPGRQPLTGFALEAATASLERLERWFDLPHPYPKLDLLALPAFAFGAMENAGAVFFRDSILLLDAKTASLEDRMRTAEVVAHELSHMWFGNSVTMKWWNDLWLNEAFATWMAYEIVDSWRPEWQVWLDFALRKEHALWLDALASSHPIAPPIRHAEEAQENFDAITYTKGASVLRMLERYLGAEVFREGIRLYMRRHSESNAEAADLWAALAEVSAEPIEKIVAPWTLQTGFPVVTPTRRTKKGTPTLDLVQERFLALPSRSKRDAGMSWTIPWVGRIGSGEDGNGNETRTLKRLFSKHRDSIPSGGNFAWAYANGGEAGFFRVNHGEQGQHELLAHLGELSTVERIGLVGNQWALCQAERLPIAALLDLLSALDSEEDPDVLGVIESVLSALDRRLVPRAGAAAEVRFRTWICDTFGPQLEVIGVTPKKSEGDRARMRRARLLSIVGGLGRGDRVVRESERLCAQHFSEGMELAAELAGPIIRIAAAGGGPFLHAALRRATTRAETPQSRRIHLLGLAAFEDAMLIAKSLDTALDPDFAPAPDRAQLIHDLLGNPRTAMLTWTRLQRVWKRLERQMPPILLARLAAATAQALPASEMAGILAFFEQQPLLAGPRAVRQISEELKIAARFERASCKGLVEYLID